MSSQKMPLAQLDSATRSYLEQVWHTPADNPAPAGLLLRHAVRPAWEWLLVALGCLGLAAAATWNLADHAYLPFLQAVLVCGAALATLQYFVVRKHQQQLGTFCWIDGHALWQVNSYQVEWLPLAGLKSAKLEGEFNLAWPDHELIFGINTLGLSWPQAQEMNRFLNRWLALQPVGESFGWTAEQRAAVAMQAPESHSPMPTTVAPSPVIPKPVPQADDTLKPILIAQIAILATVPLVTALLAPLVNSRVLDERNYQAALAAWRTDHNATLLRQYLLEPRFTRHQAEARREFQTAVAEARAALPPVSSSAASPFAVPLATVLQRLEFADTPVIPVALLSIYQLPNNGEMQLALSGVSGLFGLELEAFRLQTILNRWETAIAQQTKRPGLITFVIVTDPSRAWLVLHQQLVFPADLKTLPPPASASSLIPVELQAELVGHASPSPDLVQALPTQLFPPATADESALGPVAERGTWTPYAIWLHRATLTNADAVLHGWHLPVPPLPAAKTLAEVLPPQYEFDRSPLQAP